MHRTPLLRLCLCMKCVLYYCRASFDRLWCCRILLLLIQLLSICCCCCCGLCVFPVQLCVQARASGCPLWFVSSESEKLHPSLPLNTAVVLPIDLEADSTGNQEGSYAAVGLMERNWMNIARNNERKETFSIHSVSERSPPCVLYCSILS